MRRLQILAVVFIAGCGANYSPTADLPDAPGTTTPVIASTNQVCRACAVDGDCGPGGFCATEDLTGAQWCTAPCYSDGTCDDGQTCFTVNDNGDTGCYPSSGSCESVVATGSGAGSGNGATDGTSATTAANTTAASTTGTTSVVTTGEGSTGGATTAAGTTGGTSTTAAAATTGTAGASTTNSGTTATSTTTASSTTAGATTGSGTTTSTSTSTSTSTTGTTGACTPDSWSSTMSSFFSYNCAQCHNATKSWVTSNKSQVKSKIQSGSMPPSGGVSQQEISAVVTWINCGLP